MHLAPPPLTAPPKRGPTRRCSGSWRSAARTSDGRVIRADHVEGRSDCPCTFCRRKRGAQRARGLDEVLGTTGLLHLVVTVPEPLRDAITDVAAFRDAAAATMIGWFRETFDVAADEEIGAAPLVHPTGEDLRVWKPHVHGVIALSARRPDGTLRPLKWAIPADTTRAATKRDLARRWGRALAALTGRPVPAAPIVFARVHRESQRIRRLLVRELRSFPGWTKSMPRLQSLGFLSPSRRGKARAALGLAPRKKAGPIQFLTALPIVDVDAAIARASEYDARRHLVRLASHEKKLKLWGRGCARALASDTALPPKPRDPGYLHTVPAWLVEWHAHRSAGVAWPYDLRHDTICPSCRRARLEVEARERWREQAVDRREAARIRRVESFNLNPWSTEAA